MKVVSVKIGDRVVDGEVVDFETVKEDWSVYKVADGSTIRFKPVVYRIIRTNELNANGEPIYHIEWSPMMVSSVPEELVKKALVAKDDDSNWAIKSIGPRGRVSVKEHEDKKFMELKGPREFEGRRFRLEFVLVGTEPVNKGRFQVKYYLYNPFVVFDDETRILSKSWEATRIKVARELAEKPLKFLYSIDNDPPNKVLEISFGISNADLLERLILVLDEGDLDTVLQVSDQIAGNFLDFISLSLELPIDVRGVETSSIDTGKIVDKMTIIPYLRTGELLEEDVQKAFAMPKVLIPLLRLLREARNSPNPYYQLLCLFRIYEGLKKKIRADNYKKVGSMPQYAKPKRRIPENEFIREYFPNWIGRPFDQFFEWVEHNYRDSIAHLVRKNPTDAVPDPASIGHAILTDRVNCMQISMLRILILDEWEFMQRNGID